MRFSPLFDGTSSEPSAGGNIGKWERQSDSRMKENIRGLRIVLLINHMYNGYRRLSPRRQTLFSLARYRIALISVHPLKGNVHIKQRAHCTFSVLTVKFLNIGRKTLLIWMIASTPECNLPAIHYFIASGWTSRPRTSAPRMQMIH
jgi:hypothetical protein